METETLYLIGCPKTSLPVLVACVTREHALTVSWLPFFYREASRTSTEASSPLHLPAAYHPQYCDQASHLLHGERLGPQSDLNPRTLYVLETTFLL